MEKIISDMPCAMTIAGSDSGAGAGIQADLFAFAANGVYGTSAIAALTAQNPDEVRAISSPDSAMLRAQAETVAEFYAPKAAKTGMLFCADIVETVADFFLKHREIALVVDPVMISTSGAKLLKDDAVSALKEKLIPLAKVFTPNIDEAEFLLGEKISDPLSAAKKLREKFGAGVLLKGGHLKSDRLTDVLACADGKVLEFFCERIKGVNTHGSGCTLSAAIAANLAKGLPLPEAVERARTYLLAGMKNPLKVGGQYFINHFPNLG